MQKKILFLSPRSPYPLNDGGRIRIFQSLYFLAKLFDVDILYVYTNEDTEFVKSGIKKYVENVFSFQISKIKQILYGARGFFNGMPIRNNMFYCRKIQRWIDVHIDNYDAVFCQGLRMTEYVKKYTSLVKYVDIVDALSMNYDRARFRTSFLYSVYYRIDFRRLCKCEDSVIRKFDRCAMISKVDKQYIEARNGMSIPKLKVVGNMVKMGNRQVIPSKTPMNILFVGKMNYDPNVLAVSFFVHRILPYLLIDFPKIKFYIVGASPNKQVKKLAGENVIVTGFVEDLFDYYSQTAVVVAPMRTGAGIQNKIIQAMSLGCCVLTTSIGAEGLDINSGGIIVEDEEKGIINSLKILLSKPELRDAIGVRARKYILDRMVEDVVFSDFKDFIYDNIKC